MYCLQIKSKQDGIRGESFFSPKVSIMVNRIFHSEIYFWLEALVAKERKINQ
jgi:hypothetical protein